MDKLDLVEAKSIPEPWISNRWVRRVGELTYCMVHDAQFFEDEEPCGGCYTEAQQGLCGNYAEYWLEMDEPRGWKGCSLPLGHSGDCGSPGCKVPSKE